MDDVKVYVIDTVVTKPGRGQDFVDAYLREYAPGARERGMVLERVVVSPPMWLVGESNTVTATWVLDGAAGWWAMTWRGRGDEAVRRWWAHAAEYVVERTRSTAAAVADLERLADGLGGAPDTIIPRHRPRASPPGDERAEHDGM
uniref:hypothetical protein n=1 Tax=Nocardia neocaledoniensis TaxID=236511 RepID=UPI00313E4A98